MRQTQKHSAPRRSRAGTALAAALAASLAHPFPVSGQEAAEAGALLDRYETCLGQEEPGVCAGMLAASCLDLAEDLDALSACRAVLTTALEERVGEIVAQIGSAAGPAARRVALEQVRGAERSVAQNCDAYAEATPQADTPHHAIRCALIAAHLKMVTIHGLRADLEPEL